MEQGNAMNYRDYIVTDPAICGGQPTLRGTRVLLRTVLAYLADGNGAREILSAFPSLTEAHVRAAIAFAAASAGEDLPTPAVPPIPRVA